jgi:hypothetical protein
MLVLQESLSSSSSLDEEEEKDEDAAAPASISTAENLLRKAEQLRREVEALEQSKRVIKQQQERKVVEQQKIMTDTAAAAQSEQRYSAILPILKPDGTTVEERVNFSPRYKDGSSSICTCVVSSLPLGIVLGECEAFDSNNEDFLAGCTMVDEVAAGSHGALAGLRPGDLLRAISACRVTMDTTPTWQLVLGGIGVPKTVRFMYVVDNRPLDEVLDAVVSNRQDPQQRPVVLVVERRFENRSDDG